jgi:hypothetical protein
MEIQAALPSRALSISQKLVAGRCLLLSSYRGILNDGHQRKADIACHREWQLSGINKLAPNAEMGRVAARPDRPHFGRWTPILGVPKAAIWR